VGAEKEAAALPLPALPSTPTAGGKEHAMTVDAEAPAQKVWHGRLSTPIEGDPTAESSVPHSV
jgi:hypothetical protein